MKQNNKKIASVEKRTKTILNPMLKMLTEEGTNLKVLDAGCGNGEKSELIIKLGNEVWGIDKDLGKLKEAEKRGVKIFEGDLEKNLPFESNFFNVVWCSAVLEHIYHTEHFLRECHRVLNAKGILIINASNINSLTNRIRLFFGLYPKWVAPSENYPWEKYSHPRFTDHVRCFNRFTFEEILERAGFKIEKITSDCICFNPKEITLPPWSEFLGKILPSLGEVLIAKARKNVKN